MEPDNGLGLMPGHICIRYRCAPALFAAVARCTATAAAAAVAVAAAAPRGCVAGCCRPKPAAGTAAGVSWFFICRHAFLAAWLCACATGGWPRPSFCLAKRAVWRANMGRSALLYGPFRPAEVPPPSCRQGCVADFYRVFGPALQWPWRCGLFWVKCWHLFGCGG